MTVLLVMEDMKWLRCVTCDSPVAAPVGDGGHEVVEMCDM